MPKSTLERGAEIVVVEQLQNVKAFERGNDKFEIEIRGERTTVTRAQIRKA